MNNIDLFKSFNFNHFQMRKYHYTDQIKTGGIPFNYFAKMLTGTAQIKTPEKTLSISPGDVFFIPKGLKYQSYWYGDEKDQISWLSFGFDAFPVKEEMFFTLQKINCSPKAAAILKELSDHLTDISTGKLNVNSTSIGLLYLFIGETMKDMERDHPPYNLIIEEALSFMQSTEEYSFKDVALHCHVSESGLYGIFRKTLGKTPLDIKQETACKKAVRLLTTTDLSVEEISNRLHFSSSSYFRKILKKHLNKTPLEIRKEAKF